MYMSRRNFRCMTRGDSSLLNFQLQNLTKPYSLNFLVPFRLKLPNKQAEKLKSREMKEVRIKNDEGWNMMTDEWTTGRTFVNVESLSRLKNVVQHMRLMLHWFIFWSTAWCALSVYSGWTKLDIEYWFVQVLVSSGALDGECVDQMSKHNINCLFWNINCHSEHISTAVQSSQGKYEIL